MADVNISKFRASVVRDGSKPASPGFVVSEGQSPTDPAGSGQNHLPVTIAAAATGLAITESQILSGAGTVGQYIRGDGSLADFPSASGGGSSVSYYLNGSVAQGTIGGVAYKELSKVPVLGTGTDFTINADGYIASFLTDAGDPNLLEIPGGNWNFETYFSASSSGGTPTFYVELYKYDGSTFTLIASNSGAPEFIAFGTTLTSYFSTLAVPTTSLALTDRLAIRYYVTHSGRTITLHTEDNHLCQVITTFTTGLTALNGLTAQVQNFAVGTSGNDFNIVSASATHTFNLPTATATMRGALSSADWSTFNAKQNALTLTTTGSSGAATLVGNTLNIPNYSPDLSGYVPTSRTITINGTTQDLSANRTFNVGTVTSVGLYSATSGVTIGSTPVTSSGTITLAIATASGSQNGLLSSTDWTTFNNKQNALTNPVTGTGTTNYLAKFTGGTTVGNSQVFDNGTFVGIGTGGSSIGNDFVSVFFNSSTARSQAINIKDTNASASGSTFEVYRKSDDTYLGNIRRNGTDDAIFVGGNSYLALGANNTEFARITSGGNLLVGTTTDNGARLQVNGAGGIRVNEDGSGTKVISIRSDFAGVDPAVNVATNNSLLLMTNNTERMRITSSGNVGIGTISPSSKLEIVGDAEMLNLRNSTTSTMTGRIGVRTDGAMQIYSFQSGVSYKPVIFGVDGGFLSAGNVLIGTTTDGGARLQIVSTGVALNMATSNGQMANINSTNANGGYITWQTSGTTIADLGTAQQIFGSGGNDTFGINGRGARALTFGTNDVERFRISSTGFVSAGATTNGRLGVRGFTNDSSGYAFEAANASGNTLFIVRNDGVSTFSSNVGIGTFSPSAPLHIVTPTGVNFQNAIRFEKAGGYGEVNLENYYTSGSNYGFGIDVAGTTMMVVNNLGNVGIGTSSPAERLHVETSSEYQITWARTGAGKRWAIGTDTAGFYFNNRTDSILPVYITNGGNVLIGTTTDNGARLQVSGTATVSSSLTAGSLISASATFSNFGSATAAVVAFADGNTGFFRPALNTLGITTAGAERMRITSSGNVGIGTASPYGRLELFGSGNAWSTAPAIRMWDSLNNLGWLVGNVNNQTAGDFYIRTLPSVSGNPSTGQEQFVIKHSTGNLGIGTMNPTNKLHVASADNEGIFMQGTNNGGHWFNFRSANSNLWSMGAQPGLMGWYNRTDATYKMVITDGGNVMIGSTSDNGSKLQVNGAIRTANPSGSTSDGWLLGRALVSGSSTPDRWIRVQIGNLYYDILAVYMGSV